MKYEGSIFNHPLLETQLVSSSDGLTRLSEAAQRSFHLRFSYWKNNSIRFSEDALRPILPESADGNQRWLVDLTPLFDSPDTIHSKEVYLYVDVVDSSSGVPVAWGATRLLFKDDENRTTSLASNDTLICLTTGDAVKCSIPLRFNECVGGLSYRLPCSIVLESSVVFGKDKGKLTRPYPQSSIEWMKNVYPRGESIFLTVADLLLSPDITEVYAGRCILVRAVGKNSSQYSFLGSVEDSKGNWMECNEVYSGLNADQLIVQVFLLTALPGKWQESLVCQAVLSPECKIGSEAKSKRNRLSSGTYECRLSTTIHSPSCTPQEIKVGKIRLELKVDSGRITLPYRRVTQEATKDWILQEVKGIQHATAESQRSRLFKVVYLLGLIEVENFAAKEDNLVAMDELLGLLLTWQVWTTDLLADMTAFIVQLQLQERLLFVLNYFFEDWLTSEFLHELIALSQLPADIETYPSFSSSSSSSSSWNIEHERAKVASLEKAAICLAVVWQLHSEWSSTFTPPADGMTSQYVQEIAPDLLQAVLAFKLQYLKRLQVGMTGKYEQHLLTLSRLQDLESLLYSLASSSLPASVDEYHQACSCVELRYLIDTQRVLGQDLTSHSVQHQLLFRCTAQQLGILSRYLARIAEEARNATSALRVGASYMQFLDAYCVLLRRMARNIAYFTEFLTAETVLVNALLVVRGVFCRSIRIHATPLVYEDCPEEVELERISAAFRNLTSFLEMGQIAAEKRSSMRHGEVGTAASFGHMPSRLSTGRRLSYASIARNAIDKSVGKEVTIRRVMFDEDPVDGSSSPLSDEGVKRVKIFTPVEPAVPSMPIIPTVNNPNCVLQSSPIAVHRKVMSLSQPAAAEAPKGGDKKAPNLVQDDHDFYHTLDQMTTYTGSALLVVLELCKPFFTCLYSIASTVSMFYELHSRQRADQIKTMFAELQSMIFQVFKHILVDNEFTAASIQVVLTRYLNSTLHMAVHMRSGLMTFLHFVTSIDRLYGQCPSLRASKSSTNLQELQRHVQTLTAYSAIVKVLYDSGSVTDPDCKVLAAYSNGHYSTHLHDLMASTGLEMDSLYQRNSMNSILTLSLSLRERAQLILFAMLDVFSMELSRPKGKWEADLIYLLSKTTSLTGMQACCSVLRSLTDMTTLYQGSRKADWLEYLDRVYSIAYLQSTVTGMINAVTSMQDVRFDEANENAFTLQELLADIRSYLVGIVLELTLVTKPCTVSMHRKQLHLSMQHKQLLQDRKTVMNDFFLSQTLLTALRGFRHVRVGQGVHSDGSTELLQLGIDDPVVDTLLSDHEAQWSRELLEVLGAMLTSHPNLAEVLDVRRIYQELYLLAMQSMHVASMDSPSTQRSKTCLLQGLASPLRLQAVCHRSLFWLSELTGSTAASYDASMVVSTIQSALHSEHLRLMPRNHATQSSGGSWNRFAGIGPSTFLSFLMFYCERFTAQFEEEDTWQWKGALSQSSKGGANEKELQHLRDCLAGLLAAGYWEIGIQMATLYRALQPQQPQFGSEKAAAGTGGLSLAVPGTSGTGNRMLKSSPSRKQLSQFFNFSEMGSPRSPPTPGMPRPRSFFTAPNSLPVTSAVPFAGPEMSPQRSQTIRSELGRVLTKLEDKLKHEGVLRMPTLYYALRFASPAPFCVDVSSLSNGWTEDLLNCVEMQRCNITDVLVKQWGAEEMSWYEEWYILRFDMSAFASVATFYRDYLQEQAKREVPESESTGISCAMGDLNHPLTFQRLVSQVCQVFPDFSLVPSYINLETMLAAVPVASPSLGLARYVQCFVACPADVCKDASDLTMYSEPLLRVKKRILQRNTSRRDDEDEDGEDRTGSDENDERGGSDDSSDDEHGDVMAGDINDLIDLNQHMREVPQNVEQDAGKWRIKRGLDKQYLSFTTFPTGFFAYATSGVGEEALDVCRYALSVSPLQVAVDDITSLQARMRSQGGARATPSPSEPSVQWKLPDEGAKDEDDEEEKEKDTEGKKAPLFVNSMALCPVVSAVHEACTDLSVQDACMETMLYTNVLLARVYRSVKHCNSLTLTELSNQPDATLLHSDHLFQTAFCILCNLFATPATFCVGLTNVDEIIAKEREKVESKWQDMRKHAKREYMREVSVFEQSTRDLLRAKTVELPKKPQEPNLSALKAAYDQQAGLDRLELLQQHRDLAFEYCSKIIKEMRKFVDKLRANLSAQGTQGESEAKRAGTDAEISVAIKMKMCLYIDALYNAMDLGIGL